MRVCVRAYVCVCVCVCVCTASSCQVKARTCQYQTIRALLWTLQLQFYSTTQMFLLFSAPQIDVKIQQAVSASRSSERINMSEGNEWHYWTTRCVHEGLMRLLLSHWFPGENVNVFIIHSSKVYVCHVKLQKRPLIVWDTQRELLMGYQSWHIEQEEGRKETQRWSWSRNIECWFASMLCVYISFCFPRSITLM